MYDIFGSEKEIMTLHVTVRIKTNKTIWPVKVMRILYSDIPCDANYFKIKWLDTNYEDRVLIKCITLIHKKDSDNCQTELFQWVSYGIICS